MKNQKGLLVGSGFAASVFAFGIASGLISPKDAAIAHYWQFPALSLPTSSPIPCTKADKSGR
jgi:hypothetical protein